MSKIIRVCLTCPKCQSDKIDFSRRYLLSRIGAPYYECSECQHEFFSEWGTPKRVVLEQPDQSGDPYLATIDRLEPNIAAIDSSAGWASASISLKRLADHADQLLPLAAKIETHLASLAAEELSSRD